MDPLSLLTSKPTVLGPNCAACGLHASCKNPVIQEANDPRHHPPGIPHVLFVMERPLAEDDRQGRLMADMRTADFTDYAIVGGLQARVRYTSLVRCYPGLEPGKGKDAHPKIANVRACTSTFLQQSIAEFRPDVIVALGDACLKALWPASAGQCPSVTKARSFPLRLESGAYLVCGYDPMIHFYWIESDGRIGRSLEEEYIRLHSLISELIAGTWAPTTTTYKDIRTQADMSWLLQRFLQIPIDWPVCPDTEVDVYIEKGAEKFKLHDYEDWETKTGRQLDDKKTVWHPDARLLMLGVSVEILHDDGTYGVERYVIHPDLIVSDHHGNPNPNLVQLLRGRWLIPYNGKSDFIDLYVFCGWYAFDPRWNLKAPPRSWSTMPRVYDDGFYMRYLRDQSLMDNSLKATAYIILSIPEWSIKVYQEMDAARDIRLKMGEPGYRCMGDVQYGTLAEYNAGDTGNGLDVGLELLEQQNFPTLAYEWMLRITVYFCDVEIEGLCFHFDKLCATIDRKEMELETSFQEIRQHWAVQAAEAETKKTFNVRSPIFYETLLGILDGLPRDPEGKFIFPETDRYPRTPSKKISQDKHTIAKFAGDLLSPAGALLRTGENKTPSQLLWTAIREWRRKGDDLTKYWSYLEYCVDDGDGDGIYRIHPNFRLGKTEQADADVDNDQGGTKSGRSSAKPNTQNFKDDDDFHDLIVAPPGYQLVILDYDRIELVWIGWNCQDALYMDWARQGLDQHIMNGAKLFAFKTKQPESAFWAYKSLEAIQNDPEGECAPEQKPWRKDGKTGNFAVGYLQEPETTAQQTGQPVEEVIELYRNLDALHPGVVQKKYELYEALQRGEYVTSYLLECRRSAVGWERSSMPPEVFFSWDPDTRNRRNSRNIKQFRSLWNSVAGQTDANHCTSVMLAQVNEDIKSGAAGLNPDWVRGCNYVHDSGWFYIKDHYVTTAVPVIQAIMMDTRRLPKPFGLPLGVTAEVGPSYSQMKKFHCP